MKKTAEILFLLLSLLIFLTLIFASSPYRELRPYQFFGKNLPEKLGQTTKMINGKKTVLIDTDQITELFYIDQIPVTIGDYRRCIRTGACQPHHYRYYYAQFWSNVFSNIFPVTFVNWFDAHVYCLNAGGNLPSELQWELAAGLDFESNYPWGNNLPDLSRANIDGLYQWHTPAGWLPNGASPYGILDMTGNIREWVLDEIYADNDNKLLKGGGDADSFADGTIEAYFDHTPASSGFNRGFRCVYPVK